MSTTEFSPTASRTASTLRQFAAMTFPKRSVSCAAMKQHLSLAIILFVMFRPGPAIANHGPATSAGGVTVESAEPIPEGEMTFVLRENYTSYEDLTRAEVEARGAAAGGFDYLKESFITTLGTAYGVSEDFDLSASIGWYSGRGFVDAEGTEHGEAGDGESSVGNPSGLTDLKLDTSSLYTHRFERDGFRVGDRLDSGVALSFQFTDSHVTFPRLTFFTELNHIWLDKDDSADGRNRNSGGTSLFLTGGLRLEMDGPVSLTVAPSIPLYQDSNGDQVEVDYKLTGLLTIGL